MVPKAFKFLSIHNKVAAVYMTVSFVVSLIFAMVFYGYNHPAALTMGLGSLVFLFTLSRLLKTQSHLAKCGAIVGSYLLTLIQMTLFFPRVTQFHLFYMALLIVVFTTFEINRTSSKVWILGASALFLFTSVALTLRASILNVPGSSPTLTHINCAIYVSIYIGLTFILYYFSTEMHQIKTKMTALATLDPLTGLSNRRVLLEKGHSLALNSLHTGDSFALLMVDIDDFKRINDIHGHPGGDQVLVQLAHLFHTHLRPTDLATRYGGEEFALLLPSADESHASNIAHRLCQIVAETPFHLQDRSTLHVTISIGVSTFSAHAHDFDTLMSHADLALYGAKSAGKNQFQTLATKIS